MAIRSDRLVVSLISDLGYYTFLYGYARHNREGGRKEQTNKHRLRSAPSARGEEVYVTLFVHSVFLWTNASVYSSKNPYKATSNADLTSRVSPPGLCRSTDPSSHPSDFYWLVSYLPDSHLPDCFLLSTGPFCTLLLTVFFWDLPSLVLPISWEILCGSLLCAFRPTHRERDAWHSVTIVSSNLWNL